MRRRVVFFVSLLLALPVLEAWSAGFGTAFTYQGRLTDGTGPATASYDMQFKLFDSLSNVTGQVGSTVSKPGVAVTGGLFTVSLDFGASAFDGNPRWLEIAVSPAGMGTYTPLAPRQPLTPAPYALYAAGPPPPSAANYAYAFDTTTQVVPLPSNFFDVIFNTNGVLDGWIHTPGTAPFTATTSGLYLVQYQAEVERSGGTLTMMTLRLTVNGVEVPGSRATADVATSNVAQPLGRSLLLSTLPGDVLGLQVMASTLFGEILSATGAPSAAITITRIQ